MGNSVKKIGLFGGTFSPFHFGHLNLAIELKEKNGLDEVWLIPTLLSPFKSAEEGASFFHRMKMLELVCKELKGFVVLDLEEKRPPPSYTIDTVKEIIQKYSSDNTFFLLLGEEALLHFSEWKEPQEIVRLLPLLIGGRVNAELIRHLPELCFSDEICLAIHKGMVEIPMMDISATVIRERLKKRLYCGHLIPAKILDYIYQNQLYS